MSSVSLDLQSVLLYIIVQNASVLLYAGWYYNQCISLRATVSTFRFLH